MGAFDSVKVVLPGKKKTREPLPRWTPRTTMTRIPSEFHLNVPSETAQLWNILWITLNFPEV